MARIGMLTEEQFADQFAPTLAPPIGDELAGTFQAKDADLDAYAALATTGLVARTGAGTAATRTITAGAGITVSNGDGVAGNPSIASLISQYTDEQARDAIGTALLGTANQITVTVNDGADTLTLSLPNAITAPGSLIATTSLHATTTLSCDGNSTLGNAAGDVHTINGAATQTVNANGQQGFNISDGSNNLRMTPSDAVGVARIGTTTNDDLSIIRNGAAIIAITASVSVSTAFSTAGNATLGDASTDAHTANGTLTVTQWAKVGSFTVATLPSAATAGDGALAFASNGRKTGEGAGAGTGLVVYADGGTWFRPADDTAVAA